MVVFRLVCRVSSCVIWFILYLIVSGLLVVLISVVLGLIAVCVIYGCVDDLTCWLISYSGGDVIRFGVCVWFCCSGLDCWFCGFLAWCLGALRWLRFWVGCVGWWVVGWEFGWNCNLELSLPGCFPYAFAILRWFGSISACLNCFANLVILEILVVLLTCVLSEPW